MVSSNTRKWRSKELVLRVHHTHSQNQKHDDRLEYDYTHGIPRQDSNPGKQSCDEVRGDGKGRLSKERCELSGDN